MKLVQTISLFLISISIAYYLFLYVPESNRKREFEHLRDARQKASQICEEERDKTLEALSSISTKYRNETGEIPEKGSILYEKTKEVLVADWVTDCINSKLNQWGY